MVIDKLPSTDGDGLIQLHQHAYVDFSDHLQHSSNELIIRPHGWFIYTVKIPQHHTSDSHRISANTASYWTSDTISTVLVSDGISDKIFYSAALDWTLWDASHSLWAFTLAFLGTDVIVMLCNKANTVRMMYSELSRQKVIKKLNQFLIIYISTSRSS